MTTEIYFKPIKIKLPLMFTAKEDVQKKLCIVHLGSPEYLTEISQSEVFYHYFEGQRIKEIFFPNLPLLPAKIRKKLQKNEFLVKKFKKEHMWTHQIFPAMLSHKYSIGTMFVELREIYLRNQRFTMKTYQILFETIRNYLSTFEDQAGISLLFVMHGSDPLTYTILSELDAMIRYVFSSEKNLGRQEQPEIPIILLLDSEHFVKFPPLLTKDHRQKLQKLMAILSEKLPKEFPKTPEALANSTLDPEKKFEAVVSDIRKKMEKTIASSDNSIPDHLKENVITAIRSAALKLSDDYSFEKDDPNVISEKILEVVESSPAIREIVKQQKQIKMVTKDLTESEKVNPEIEFRGKKFKFRDMLKPAKVEKVKFDLFHGSETEENRKNSLMTHRALYDETLMLPDLCKTFNKMSEVSEYPLFITDFKVTNTSDALNRKNTFSIKYKAPTGKVHSVKMDIPITDRHGLMRLNGQRKVILHQLMSIIVKTKPDTVSVTMMANKAICLRTGSTVSKSLVEFINKSPTDTIGNIRFEFGKTEFPSTLCSDMVPFANSVIHATVQGGDTVGEFGIGKTDARIRKLSESLIKKFPKSGFDLEKAYFFMKVGNTCYAELNSRIIALSQKGVTELDESKTMFSLVLRFLMDNSEEIKTYWLGRKSTYRSFSVMQILKKKIPIGIVLSYLYGIDWLIEHGRISGKFVSNDDTSTVVDNPTGSNARIVFRDGVFIYDGSRYASVLLMSGFTTVATEQFEYAELQEARGNAYAALFSTARWMTGMSTAMMDAIRFLEDTFIDHITKELLVKMGIPDTFGELFIYVSDLLTTDHLPPESSLEGCRIRNNEAIVHRAYQTMTQAFNRYRRAMQRNPKTATLDVKQNGVITDILMSPNVETPSGLGPGIQSSTMTKVSYRGVGGINLANAIKMGHRTYDKSMKNILAISTVFNSNAGAIRYLASQAQLDARGVPDISENMTFAGSQSVSERINTHVVRHDSGPRVLMDGVQLDAYVAPVDGNLPLYGTGGHKLIAYTSPDFAYASKDSGVITEVSEKKRLITLKYDDGTVGHIDLNPQIVKNTKAKFSVKVQLVPASDVKKGMRFEKNRILAYDKSYFRECTGPDYGVGMVCGVLVNVAMQCDSTFEDSVTKSEDMARRAGFRVVDQSEVVLGPKTVVTAMAKTGDKINMSTLISYNDSVEDEGLSVLLQQMIAENSESLANSTKSLKSYHNGVLIDVTIMWNVDIEEMSESLQKIVKDYIETEKRNVSGDSEDLVREKTVEKISQKKIGTTDFEGVYIRFSVEYSSDISTGCKTNAHCALKGVTSTVLPNDKTPICEFTGEPVDMEISVESYKNREVPSFVLHGFTNKIIVGAKRNLRAIIEGNE